MVWQTSPGDGALALRAAAHAALGAAADLGRGAAARAPALVEDVQWRSRAFDAFRARVADWHAELEALAGEIERAPGTAPAATPIRPWREP